MTTNMIANMSKEESTSAWTLARICENAELITDVIELVPDEPASTGGMNMAGETRITENGIDYIRFGDYYIPDLKRRRNTALSKVRTDAQEYLEKSQPD